MNRTAQNIYKILSLSVFFVAISQSIGHSESNAGRIIEEYAEKAIHKGYGDLCGLDMQKSADKGYYPCLDFGPYRYVRAYQNVAVYVVQENMMPYLIMKGPQGSMQFYVQGPWENDVTPRLITYWNDVIEGGAAKAKELQDKQVKKSAAETYINSLVSKERPAEASSAPADAQNKEENSVQHDSDIGKAVDDADLQKALQQNGG